MRLGQKVEWINQSICFKSKYARTFEPHLLVEYSELEKEREGGEKGPNLRLFLRCDILSFH
ncbi:hypothetical protein Pint_22994 [Pistacia integerrima]|uniref:Uncharacterized protein n=1 Tax=Pistacia integerrima TaxID=434235 RepID=A0ACC0YH60_9ROSI|nr:hypothetical protein Pint_22994 [Pistacia integerrima]